MSKFNCWMRASALFLVWATAVVALPAQTLKSLYSFDASDGRYPYAGLVQGIDGDFYGTTAWGGKSGNPYAGTIFKITTGARRRHFTASASNPVARPAANPSGGWSWPPTGTSTEQRRVAGPRTMARCSKSSRVAS